MIIKNIFNKLFVTFCLLISIFILFPQIAAAGEPNFKNPKLQVPIAGLKFQDVVCENSDGSFRCYITWISDYISGIYDYALLVGGILAGIVLMAGGLIWLTSGGDVSKVTNAKKIITGGLIGLFLLFSTFLILNTINPELVNKKAITIDVPKDIDLKNSSLVTGSCCEYEYTDMDAGNFKHCLATEIGVPCKTTVKGSPTTKTYDFMLTKQYANSSCGEKNNKFISFSSSCDTTKLLAPPSDTWLWQATIKDQLFDASLELTNLISCIRKNVPGDVGIISSIGDSKHVGKLAECNKAGCCKDGKECAVCAHECMSCHYGGGTSTNKSYAVDFGDETNAAVLIAAGYKCGAKYIENEGDHVHMSVAPCPKN